MNKTTCDFILYRMWFLKGSVRILQKNFPKSIIEVNLYFTNQKSKKHFLIYTTKSNKFIKIVIKGHSELTQTSKREISVKVVNSLKLLM